MSNIHLTWYGHATTGIDTSMIKIMIDPFFTDNPSTAVCAEDIETDVIAVTHGHGDHLGDTIAIAQRTGALVISNFEIINYLRQQGLQHVHALHIGGGHGFPWGRISLTPALHGSSLPDGSYGGLAAGILLTLGDKKIYHAGDTGLFSDMKLLSKGLDLAMVPIGDNFTMGPDDALEAVKFLQPRHVIPMHYNTFELIQQDVKEWAVRVNQETNTEVQVLEPGEHFALP
jgi:L-ascorbate metabolism protein UlaG (beta-lactamase superfamily)